MEVEDYPDEEWVEDESGPEDDFLTCPSCRQPVHEETQQCPHCGDWIIPASSDSRSMRMIWVAVAVLLVVALVWITVR